jgi:signal transduction histidine kinase
LAQLASESEGLRVTRRRQVRLIDVLDGAMKVLRLGAPGPRAELRPRTSGERVRYQEQLSTRRRAAVETLELTSPSRSPDDDASDETRADDKSRIRELERKGAAVEIFARVAAHELMEPLILAESHARLIEEQLHDRDDDIRGGVDSLIRDVSRMRLLVETLLLDARSDGRALDRRPVDLARLVVNSIEMFESEIRVRCARILAGKLPVVGGDEVMLAVVLNNLVMNALRYGPREGGEVRIEARRERGQWRISVTSEGPVISEADRARIFEPYRRGFHERRAAGAGLGLTISRSFVERHGGEIGVAPAHAGGNCLYFTIPADDRPPEILEGAAAS